MALLPRAHGFVESPRRRRSGGGKGISLAGRGGKGLSPARATSLWCCPLAGMAASSAGKSKQSAEPTAHTHVPTQAHACAWMHTCPSTGTASRTATFRTCAAALTTPEPPKPLEKLQSHVREQELLAHDAP